MNELRGNARRSPAEESPVFIVGLPRSGTSILFRALMQLPAFATRVEDVAESGIMQFANRAHELAADGGDFGPFAFMLRDTAEFERFLEAIGPQRRRHRRLQRLLGRRGARALARSAFGWRAGGNDRVLRAFVRHAAAARGAARLVEKTPTDVRFAGRMLAAFAAARAICIVRHPVDTFASYRRRLEREDAAWLRITPPEFALGWRRDAGRAHALARSAPAFTVSRYEEFTTATAREFERLCAFVGEPFEPEALARMAGSKRVSTQDPGLFGAVVARERDWRDCVSAAEAAAIERTCGDVLASLGYAPYTGR